MTNIIKIGHQIRLARRQCGFTQMELGKKLGVSWEMISRYERGKTSPIHRILQLSKALDVPLDFFLQESENLHNLHSTNKVERPMIKEHSLSDGWHKMFVPLLHSLDEYHQWQIDSTSIDAMYVQPWWMITYSGVFVIKLDNCACETLLISSHTKVMVFITTQPNDHTSQYTLINKNNRLTIVRDVAPSAKIIGSVLALEQRFM